MTKNPLRTWFVYNGKNLSEIATEPALKAIRHYGKLRMTNSGISILVSAGIVGVVYVGYRVYEKVSELKPETK